MSDEYIRGDDETGDDTQGKNHSISGFRSLAFEVTQIERKVELDWKKVYLARKEGSEGRGELGWKIDLSSARGKVVDRVVVRVASECFATGRVNWTLCGDDQCLMLSSSPASQTFTELRGSTHVHLAASLSRGQGSSAWQHAQLFRQSLDETPPFYPLCIVVYMMQKAD